jgi:threonine dehydratase
LGSPSARSDVDAARALLAAHVQPTPLVPAPSLTRDGRAVHLKLETALPTGSFKVRGAIYALWTATRPASPQTLSPGGTPHSPITEVVAASTGNHGAAVAYAARLIGLPASIFLPGNPNPVKASRIRDLGARILETGADLSAAIDAAYDYCARTGAFFLHDATDPHIPIGTATIAAEIAEQLPSVGAIYVPMGDTALVRGVGSAAKHANPSVRIVGVVAARAPAYAQSWRSCDAVETASADTIADGLAVRRALAPNVAAIRALVDEIVEVGEDEMLDAMDWLETREGVIAEPSGAAATAAYVREPGRDQDPTVLLVTGANVSPDATALLTARRQRARGPRP